MTEPTSEEEDVAGRRKRKNEIQVKLTADGLIPVALYVRVSSAGQDVENSIESQLKILREWAAQNGYFVVATFIDEAKTGRADKRPNFQELILAAEDPNCPFASVLVYKFSRFYRNADESAFYKVHLKKKGIRVISILESGADNAAGRLSEKIMEAVDEYQSDLTGEEVRRGTRNLIKEKFYIAGPVAYGMMKVPVEGGKKTRYKLAPDPKTAPYIRRIFDLALEGKTERQVRVAVNAEGIPNASGKLWETNRIHDVLSNVHYADGIGWSMQTDNPLIVRGAHAGIVTKEEFDEVQRLLASRAPDVQNPHNAGNDYPLAGMMRCRKCKSKYTFEHSDKKNGKTYLYVICKIRKDDGPKACDSPRIPAEEFSRRALAAILDDVVTKQNMSAAMEELGAESGEELDRTTRKLEEADRKLEDIEARWERMYALYESGGMELEAFTRRNRELRSMREAAEADRKAILESAGDRMTILNDPEAVLRATETLNRFLREEKPPQCKDWLQRFIKRIWIEHGRGTIEYSIPLPDEKLLRTNSREFTLGENFRPSTRERPLSRE